MTSSCLECLLFFGASSAKEGSVASAFAFAFGIDVVFAAGVGVVVVDLATDDLATGTTPMGSMVALPAAVTSTWPVFSVLGASTETGVTAFVVGICADFMAVGLESLRLLRMQTNIQET